MTRWMRSVIVIVLFVAAAAVGIRQTTGIKPPKTNIEVSDACKNLTPDNWFWWRWYGCGEPAPGGGGSGAG